MDGDGTISTIVDDLNDKKGGKTTKVSQNALLKSTLIIMNN